jgi:Mn2+/Fe2+ NRAMP family transporter
MQNWRKVLGPGILFASTAIGVSHLVQSTQAGAQFGLGLLVGCGACQCYEVPIFEYGSRYAAAKGETILKGYLDLNRVWLYAYMGVISISMFFVTGAVGIVTYGFMEHLFGLNQLTDIPHFTLFLFFMVGDRHLVVWPVFYFNKLIKGLGFGAADYYVSGICGGHVERSCFKMHPYFQLGQLKLRLYSCH